jgi:hypothetical protein
VKTYQLFGLLAFNRETTTLAALWSLIGASTVFLVGAVVLYRRERRRERTKEARRAPPRATEEPAGT